jgi:hypothetical protein
MVYLLWTEFTASDIATCIIAMLRVHGLPPVLAAFMTAIAVWFQSVMTSALEGDASATTRQTFAAAIPLVTAPLVTASGRILMSTSFAGYLTAGGALAAMKPPTCRSSPVVGSSAVSKSSLGASRALAGPPGDADGRR